MGYSPWGHKRVGPNLETKQQYVVMHIGGDYTSPENVVCKQNKTNKKQF